MSRQTGPASAEQPLALRDDPRFTELFRAGTVDACIPNNTMAREQKWLEDKIIQIIALPSNYGSSRAGLTDTAGGPQYVMEKLIPTLSAGGAKVLEPYCVPVEKIAKSITPPNFENVRNASILVSLLKDGMYQGHEALAKGHLPLVLGGDHTAKIVSTGAMLMANPDPQDPTYSIGKDIHADGHADALADVLMKLTIEEFHIEMMKLLMGEESKLNKIGNAHGRTVSTLWGMGPEPLMPVMDGIPLLRPKNTLFIGCHNCDLEEAQRIKDLKSPFLGLNAFETHPALAQQFISEFVKNSPYNFTCDLDVMSKKALMTNMQEGMKPGAPMATLKGMTTNTLLNICNTLGRSRLPTTIEFSEIAPTADKIQGGLTRDHAVLSIVELLGGGNSEYHIDYDPFSS